MRLARDPEPLERSRAAELLARMRETRVVVVGDAMLDRYLVGDTERISPEAPVPVVRVHERSRRLGGAANVAANLAALGACARLVAVIGEDEAGLDLRAALGNEGLGDAHLLTVGGRPTTSKTRLLARGQQVARIDEETDAPLDGAAASRLVEAGLAALEDADALAFEDYDKGVLAPGVIAPLLDGARRRGIPIVVDPKYRHFFAYGGATVFKPNRRELEAALGAALPIDGPGALFAVRERLKVDSLLVTLGADGMRLVGPGGELVSIPSLAREVFDVSGAGDTVTAWLAAALAGGATVAEAARLANYAAGIEVGKAGVATVAPAEVLALYEEGD